MKIFQEKKTNQLGWSVSSYQNKIDSWQCCSFQLDSVAFVVKNMNMCCLIGQASKVIVCFK